MRLMRRLSSPCLLLLALSAPALASPPSPLDSEPSAWLDQMVRAMHTTSYEGVFVHVREDGFDTMRIVHGYDDAGEHERLWSLNGLRREVLRENDRCTCTWPDSQTVVSGYFPGARARLSADRFKQPAMLAENYELRLLGRERVADRACQELALVPRDALRFGYKLCVDVANDLMLRMSVFDEQGRAVEHNFFTALSVPEAPIPRENFVSCVDAQGFKHLETAVAPEAADKARTQPLDHWYIPNPPPGYRLRHGVERRNPESGQPFEHYAYTDGLSMISVFVERRGDGDSLLQESKVQSLRPGQAMRMQSRDDGPYRITVIGEAPSEVIRQFLAGMKPRPPMTPTVPQADGQ